MNDDERTSEVNRLLDLIGLPRDFAERLPKALSGGQKQRVCIARALAARPNLIICDEVTSALDPLVAEEILKLLRSLQDELGVSYLFITHDLGVVRRLADRTMVMQHGRIVETGTTEQVLRRLTNPIPNSSSPRFRNCAATGWMACWQNAVFPPDLNGGSSLHVSHLLLVVNAPCGDTRTE